MKKESKWSIDQSHSEIAFKVRHLMIAYVTGKFKIFDASIYTTAKDFSTAVIDLWIDSSSVITGDAKRDEHLKSADFFDSYNHKQISFISSTIQKTDSDGNHELWGELSIKGISKNVKLNVQFGGIIKDPWGNEKAGFTVTGTINRKDWNLIWNKTLETSGLMVGEEVIISCELELINIGDKELTIELEPIADKKKIVFP